MIDGDFFVVLVILCQPNAGAPSTSRTGFPTQTTRTMSDRFDGGRGRMLRSFVVSCERRMTRPFKLKWGRRVSVLKTNDATCEMGTSDQKLLHPGEILELRRDWPNPAVVCKRLRGQHVGLQTSLAGGADVERRFVDNSIMMLESSRAVMPDLKSKGTRDGSTCKRRREPSSTDTDVNFPNGYPDTRKMRTRCSWRAPSFRCRSRRIGPSYWEVGVEILPPAAGQ
jgi:hypothetical protein